MNIEYLKFKAEMPDISSMEIVKPKLDVVFKMLFGTVESIRLLRALISALLSIPKEEISDIVIKNVELIPDDYDDKFSRLDINLEVGGKKINIELQICTYKDYEKRNLYYWAKNYTNDLKTGQKYSELKETICISILGFDMFECTEYHSHFQVLETTRHEKLTDALSLHFFELKKAAEANDNSEMLQWLRFINAETEADLMLAEQSNIPEIRDAAIRVRELSADEKARQIAFEREMNIFEREYFYSSWERINEQLEEAQIQLDKTQNELDNTQNELDNAKNELDNAKNELDNAKNELDNTKNELDNTKNELDKAHNELINAEQVGFMKSLAGLVSKGILTVDQAAEEAGMTVEKFKEKTVIE